MSFTALSTEEDATCTATVRSLRLLADIADKAFPLTDELSFNLLEKGVVIR